MKDGRQIIAWWWDGTYALGWQGHIAKWLLKSALQDLRGDKHIEV